MFFHVFSTHVEGTNVVFGHKKKFVILGQT